MATSSSISQGTFQKFGTRKDHKASNVGHSVDSLSSYPKKPSLNTVRSRKPLSSSQAEALNNILTDGPFPLNANSKCSESGYFSEESKLSQYQTMTENLTNGDAMDQFNKEKLEPLLADIAEEFGGCWKDVGRQLLSKECLIENIDEDYKKVGEKSYQVLIKWKKEKGTKAFITDIFKCLNHISREDVAEKLLAYLPEVIANDCEMVLLSSPKKIRCPSMTTPIYNITEQHRDLTVEKHLQLQDDDEIYLCSSNITKKKYLLKEIEESPKVYKWAARMVMNDKQLSLKKRTLRKTNDFLKDLEFKEETVNSLKRIIKQLQDKLHVEHMTFCEKDLKCSNCEKTAIMRELLEKDLSLLHYELINMIRGSRRLSVSGIPTYRIYDLAERSYKVCEEHKKFHEEVSKITKLPQRRCSMELLDDESDKQYEKDKFEDPLQSTLNILRHFGRKRKVVQSLRIKPRKPSSRKVKRHSSDTKQKSKSRFYLPSDDVQIDGATKTSPKWPIRIGSKIFPQRKKSSEKKQQRKSSDPQKKDNGDNNSTKHHPRCNTFPSSLPDTTTIRPLLFSTNLNDIDYIRALSSMRISADVRDFGGNSTSNSSGHLCDTDVNSMSGMPSRLRDNSISSSASDPNLQQMQSRLFGVTQGAVCDTRHQSLGMREMLRKQTILETRQRSFSEDDVMEANNYYQGVNPQEDFCIQQSSEPELNTNILWKTEIDPDTIFFV